MRILPSRLLAPLALCALAAGAFATLRQGEWTAARAGVEHQRLAKEAGTWDAVVTLHLGEQTITTKGVETNAMVCGGKALESRFEGDMMGTVLEGRGLFTWDPSKKKYVGVWTDSMKPGMTIMEGEWSEKEGGIVFRYEGEEMGVQMANRTVTTYPDENRRKSVFYQTAPGRSEAIGMQIEYTRRAAR